jgi:hypothetical protein
MAEPHTGDLRSLSWRSRLGLVAVAIAVSALIVGGVLLVYPEAFDRKWFGRWSPAVAGIGLAVWLVAAIWERRAGRRLALFTATIGGVALAAVLLNNAKPVAQALTGSYVRAWNVYHYYVGSKYFAELGYSDLYAATMAADDEWQRRKLSATAAERERLDRVADFGHISKVRDMRSYRRIARQKAVAGFDRSGFGDARFDELGRDTRALRAWLAADTWHDVLTDLGYNPSPAWTVVGTPLANLLPIDGWGSWLVANSDLPLLALMFFVLWWAFGLRTALVAFLWLNVIHFNRARFAGGFLQYDWLASTVIGIALYHKGRAGLAGAVFGWGVMTRIFPAFLALPIAVKLVAALVRGRSGSEGGALRRFLARFERRHLRFAVALLLSCGVLFGLSHLTGRGLGTWPEWADKIGRHSHLHPLMDPQRIGLGRLVLHEPTDKDPWAAATGGREERLAESAPLKRTIQVIGLVLLAAALIRRRDEEAMVLMLFAVLLVLTLSRYYASAWLLLFALEAGRGGPERAPWTRLAAGALLFLMAALFHLPETKAGRYFLVNYEALVMFGVLVVGYLAGDLRAWRESRRR